MILISVGGLFATDSVLADGLEEIVVTAQKREQNAQDVGVTMSVLDANALADNGIVFATDIAKFVPGVNFAGSFAGQDLSFSIRGVTQQDFSVHAESPVAVYVDEGYFANNNATSIGLFDIDHVEILKGPQGTLFGRNATGGTVSITTVKPTDDYQGFNALSYGSYNTIREEAAFGGPITDNVQFRIAGLFNRNDGWVTNTAATGGDLGGEITRAVRAHLQFEPAESVKVLATAYGSWTDESWGPYLVFATRPILDANGNVVNSQTVNGLTGIGTQSSNSRDLVVDANDAKTWGNWNHVGGGTVNASWIFGPTLTSITDYVRTAYRLQLDDDAGPTSFFNTDTNAAATNFSEELRLFDSVGGTRWTTGLYYLHIRADLRPDHEELPSFGVFYDDPSTLRTNSYSAFGQIEQDLPKTVSLVTGLRVTSESKDFVYASKLFETDGIPLGDARTPYSGYLSNTLVSGKLQLEARPWDAQLLYLGYNRGVKAGNFNAPFAGSTAFPDSSIPYKPEVLNSIEGGFKSTVLGNSTQIDGAVFYYDYQNYQAFKFIGLSSQVTNNPATTKGGELSIVSIPLTHLRVWEGMSYTGNVVKDVSLNPALAPVSRVAPFTPKWKVNGGARYEIPLGGGLLSLQADAEFTGSHYFALTNFGATQVDAYTITNAKVSWETPSGWELTAFVDNLADRRYKTVGYDLTEFAGSNFAQTAFGKPRWAGGTVRFRF